MLVFAMKPFSALVLSALSVSSVSAVSCGWKMTDHFASLNTGHFFIEDGSASMAQFDNTLGLTMTLDKDHENFVLSTRRKFVAPSSFTIDMRPSNAPGIVSPVVFGFGGGDEIDLEFVGGFPKSVQTVVWHQGNRISFNTSNAPNGMNPTAGFHKYTIAWTNTSVSLSIDGKLVRKQVRKSGQDWASEPSAILFGPWAATDNPGWAGVLDWTANPRPKFRVRSISIDGCVV